MEKSNQTLNKVLTVTLYAIGVFGVGLTIVTELSHHYRWLMELCGGQSSGCADVTSTPFARMFGISVAYLGLLSYVAFLLSLRYKPSLVLPLSATMMGAELYFMWVMSSIIHIYCMFCLIQFTTVTILFIATLVWSWRRSDFLLPGGVWSTPAVVLLVFAALVIPVQVKADKTPVGMGALVTYTGDISSPVRVEIFSDYECPHCRKLEPEIDKLIKKRPDILIVFRDYVFRSHQLSPVASSYANAVAFTKGREAFVKTRTDLFDNQPWLRDYLETHLKEINFTDDLKERIQGKVKKDMARAESLGIYQTPTLAIYRDNKLVQIISGYTKYEKFAHYLD